MNKTPMFSIITVTYNADIKIERTIQSVYDQKCKDYEYILIDGKSEDYSYNIICDNAERFSESQIPYLFESEKDNGIYDAMNKGIKRAKGDWICFMNAGDMFYDSDVLEDVKNKCLEKENIGIIYGDREFYKENGLIKLEMTDNLKNIGEEMPFSHQSSFSRRELMLKHPFDLNYRIGADYEFVMWCYSNDVKFEYVNRIISKTEFGGLSTSEEAEINMLRDRIEIQRKYLVLNEEGYINKLTELEKYKKHRMRTSKIKKFIPNSILEKRIYILNLKNGWVEGQGEDV